VELKSPEQKLRAFVIFAFFMKKPKIEYPDFWEYKIIGQSRRELKEAAAEVITDRAYKFYFSRKSKKGKYISANVETKVFSESERNSIFSAFSRHPKVKVVF